MPVPILTAWMSEGARDFLVEDSRSRWSGRRDAWPTLQEVERVFVQITPNEKDLTRSVTERVTEADDELVKAEAWGPEKNAKSAR